MSATIAAVAPLFIVRDVRAALAFYRDRMGFEVTYLGPPGEEYFGIVERGGAMIMLKAVPAEPLPNARRHPWARWDAYCRVPDPDALTAEFAARGVAFTAPLQDTADGLRGFELQDADGYTLFFGRPR